MLEPEQTLFVELPEEGGSCVLHPAVVCVANEDGLRVECQEPISVRPGAPVTLYYELRRTFVKQPAEVRAACAERPRAVFELRTTGAPASAEKRTALRVSTLATDLVADFAGEAGCRVLDVSEVGLSLHASGSREVGSVVDVELRYDGERIPGTVLVQSVKRVDDERVRYGVRCVDGVIKFALAGVNLKVQRAQIRMRRGRMRRRG